MTDEECKKILAADLLYEKSGLQESALKQKNPAVICDKCNKTIINYALSECACCLTLFCDGCRALEVYEFDVCSQCEDQYGGVHGVEEAVALENFKDINWN